MRRNDHKTTSSVKFDLKFDFPVPDIWQEILEIGPRFDALLANFLLRAETARILLPVKFFTPNLKSLWAVSYSNTNFGGAYYTIYACFEQKTAFVMQNFRNLGASGDGSDHF